MPASFGSFGLQRTKDPIHRSLCIRTFMLLFNNKPPGRLFQGWPCSTGMIKSVCQSCLPTWSQDGCGSSGLCTHSYMIAFQSREKRENGKALFLYIPSLHRGRHFPEALRLCSPYIPLARTVSHAQSLPEMNGITLILIDLNPSSFILQGLGEKPIFSEHFATT